MLDSLAEIVAQNKFRSDAEKAKLFDALTLCMLSHYTCIEKTLNNPKGREAELNLLRDLVTVINSGG